MTSKTTNAAFGLNKSAYQQAEPLPVRTSFIERWACDTMGQVRRPFFLFSVILIDAIIVAAAGLIACLLTSPSGSIGPSAWLGIATIPWLMVATLSADWSYSISALRKPFAQLPKVVYAAVFVALAANGALYLLAQPTVAPAATLIWVALAITGLAVMRIVAARAIDHFAAAGRLRRKAIIVGGGKHADALVDLLKDEGNHLEILGVFDDRARSRDDQPASGESLRRLGTFDELVAFCRQARVELLIVCMPSAPEARLLQIITKLLQLPVDIRISAHTSKLRLNSKAYSYIGKVPMLPVLDRPLNDGDQMIKNIEDRVVGLALLILTAPVMLIIALAVRLESKGPILFRQKRLGFNNKPIEVFKFRSMYTEMTDATASKLVTKDDPRVTKVGRFIRKTSLDELPQLFNVLCGEMSIVGPRPHALQAKAGDDLYHDTVRSYFARHKVKPGITGWAQINGWRGETDTHEKIEQRVQHDMHYIDKWSVLLDLYIIVVTPFSLIGGRNAY